MFEIRCKAEYEVHKEENFDISTGEEYTSFEEALSYALKSAGSGRYTNLKTDRQFEMKPKLFKEKNSVWFIRSGIGEDYDNVKMTYYVSEVFSIPEALEACKERVDFGSKELEDIIINALITRGKADALLCDLENRVILHDYKSYSTNEMIALLKDLGAKGLHER